MRLSLVCVLFDPAIPTSFFNFIQLFLYLFLFFFIVIYQCHLTDDGLLIKRKMGGAQNSLPRPSLTCVHKDITVMMNRILKVLLLAVASYPA